jgi:16S rRNA (cytidine1402-2'-O)-methyltransferase
VVTSSSPHEPGTLYIVSTPVGNLGDFSFRAVDVLKSVSLVLAEDTRHTRHLLERYGIRRVSPRTTNTTRRRPSRGSSSACRRANPWRSVSDAGTPLLSDPGARLVRAAIDAGIPVRAGPVGHRHSSRQLVVSGLDTTRFMFFGFLTRRVVNAGGTGRDFRRTHTVVIYEAANRLPATLAELERLETEARRCVAREMTKQFEEVRRGTVDELRAYYQENPARAKVVLLIAGQHRPRQRRRRQGRTFVS